MGPWSTSENWYGSKSRGKIAMGWTLSPALVDIAPALVSRVHSMKTDNDEFIAGPSGYGTFLSLSLSLFWTQIVSSSNKLCTYYIRLHLSFYLA